MKYQFPENFVWGIATSAYQIEGAAYEDGKGLNIWDVFTRIPGKIRNGENADVACDFYHRYEDDIKLIADLGVGAYRFSFSWARILPNGDGEVNQAGIEFYRNMLLCMKKYGLKAYATMYHWDLPYALQLKGGFGNRDIVKWFTNYAQVLLDNFGDLVDSWVTFNEPVATLVGNAIGMFAPGLADEPYARQVIHNLLVCHGATVRMFREKKPEAEIGIVVDIWKHYPAHPGNEWEEGQRKFFNEIGGFGMLLHPIFLGGYSDTYKEFLQESGIDLKIEDGDFELISEKMDFYGLNFYNCIVDDYENMEKKKREGGNYQDVLENHIDKLNDVLHMLVDEYHVDIPIIITENGYPQEGMTDLEQILDDSERIDNCTEALKVLSESIEEGIDVRGYFLWTLYDSFEWTGGYSSRYGIYYTDYDTQERIPKKSVEWYRNVVRENAVEWPAR